MSAILDLALRAVRRQPFRYLATTIAIVLGVAFFVGTSVLTRSFGESVDSAIADSLEGVDVAVRSSHSVEVTGIDVRPPVPADTGDQLADVDGVAAAAPFFTGYAQVVTDEGKTLADGALSAQGTAWIDHPSLSAFEIVDGSPPSSATDVVVDLTTFAQGGFAVGDTVRVLPLGADQPFTIVGTMRASGSHRLGGQTLSFSVEGAEAVLGTTSAASIFVAAAEGTTRDQLLANVSAALPADLEAVTGDTLVAEYQAAVSQSTALVTTVLQVFPLIALFVGAFVIYNTFAITVVQRTRQMALLRAIGANEHQVMTSVLAESLVIGIIGSLLGVLAGIGIGRLLLAGLDTVDGGLGLRLVLPWPQMVIGAAAGTLIAVASAFLPARRAAAVPPIAALRDTAVEERATSRRRAVIAVVLMVAGIASAIAGVFEDESRLFVLGTIALLVTVFLLGPLIVRPLTHALAVPLVWRAGVVGEVARENASRSPRRTSTTAFSLAVGVALVTTATIFAATIRESVTGELTRSILADHVVVVDAPVVLQGGGIAADSVDAIAGLDGVEQAVSLRSVNAAYDSSSVQVTGATTATLAQVVDLGDTAGSLVLEAGQVALGQAEADRRGIEIGDTVEVDFPAQAASLEVVGTYDHVALLGPWLVDEAELATSAPTALASRMLLHTDDRSVVNAVSQVLAGDPTTKVERKSDYVESQAAAINQLLVLLYGLLGMSVIVALIGIVNTMSLSIFERTRELGLMRAIGTTRNQLRRAIRYESALVAGVGTATGLALGLFFGWLGAHAVDETFPDLAIPWIQVAIIGIAGIVAGVAAALLPARRASRLDVLTAIAAG